MNKEVLRRYLLGMHRATCWSSFFLVLLSLAVFWLAHELWLILPGFVEHPLRGLLKDHPRLAPWLILGLPTLGGLLVLNWLRVHLSAGERQIRQSDTPWSPLYTSVFLFVIANLALPVWIQFYLLPVTSVQELIAFYREAASSSQSRPEPSATPKPEPSASTSAPDPTPAPTPEKLTGRYVWFFSRGQRVREVDLQMETTVDRFTCGAMKIFWSNDGLLTAVDVDSGASLWQVETTDPELVVSARAPLLFTRTRSGQLVVREADSGKLLWRDSGQILLDEDLYRLEGSTLTPLNGMTGQALGPAVKLPEPLTEVKLDQGLVAGRSGSSVVVLEASTGKKLWSLDYKGNFSIEHGRLFTRHGEGLAARDLRTGKVVLEGVQGELLTGMSGSVVLQHGPNLVALDPGTSQQQWIVENAHGWSQPLPSMVVALERSAGKLRAFGRNGESLFQQSIEPGVEVRGLVGGGESSLVLLVSKP